MSKKVTIPREVAVALTYVRDEMGWDDKTIIKRVIDNQSCGDAK